MHQITAAHPMPMLLGESPVWDGANGLLYWIDIPGKALHRLHPDSGKHDSWPMPSEPGCIALHAEGGLVVALRTGLARFLPESGALHFFHDAPYDQTRMRFNDGRCDARGRLVTGTIYEPRDRAAAPLFSVERGAVRDLGLRATVSNGVAFSLDGKTLYHADTTSHRIHAYDYDLDTGTPSNGRLLREFMTDKSSPMYGGRPDGAAVDSEGAYWIAMMEGARLLRLSPTGELLREIALPARCPTMVCFGGADLRTLYVTTARMNRPQEEIARFPLSGFVLQLRVDVPGVAEPAYLP